MATFLELVETEYGTRDLYKVLGLSKEAKDSEIKRAYHKLSLKVHPDRVELDQIEGATRKFQVLSKIYNILSDADKRGVYNETGDVPGEDDDPAAAQDWVEAWKLLFKSVTVQDIKEFEQRYKGSLEEKEELKSAYLDYEGDMDKILETIICAEIEDEPRYRELITGWIADGSLPSYPAFVGETKAKREKRKRKRNKEAEEAETMRKELGLEDENDSLKMLIKSRQQDRHKAAESFFDQLEEKYAPKTKKKKTESLTSNSKKRRKK